MELILVVALIICFARCQAYKYSIKTMRIYFEKKGYTPPTDDELR